MYLHHGSCKKFNHVFGHLETLMSLCRLTPPSRFEFFWIEFEDKHETLKDHEKPIFKSVVFLSDTFMNMWRYSNWNASAPKELSPHNLHKDDELMQKKVVGTKAKLNWTMNCAFVHILNLKVVSTFHSLAEIHICWISHKYLNFFCKYQNLPERSFPVFVPAIYIFPFWWQKLSII